MYYKNDILLHHGVKGMKWGKRKTKDVGSTNGRDPRKNTAESSKSNMKADTKRKFKKAAIIGAAAVGTALAAYGAKKMHDVVRDKNLKQHIETGRKLAEALTGPIRLANDTYRDFAKPFGIGNYEAKIRENDSLISEIFKNELDKSYNRAQKDSFSTALKNVVNAEIAKRRR